jgi:hypothetical protein
MTILSVIGRQFVVQSWLAVGTVLGGGHFAALASATAQPTASLTITTTAPGFGGGRPYFLVEVLAGGALPEGTSVPLVNADGQNEVFVTVDAAACGPHADVRATTLGKTPWCLKIGEPAPGSSVTGTVSSPSSSVVLTVSSRRNVAGWPLLVALAGLATALLLVVLSPSFFGSIPRRLRLHAALATRYITGLDYAWVKAHLNGRSSGDPSVVTPVRDAAEHGRARADAARKALAALVTDVKQRNPNWKVLEPAERELDRDPDHRRAPGGQTSRRFHGFFWAPVTPPAPPAPAPEPGGEQAPEPPYLVHDFLDDTISPCVHPAVRSMALVKDALACGQTLDQDEALIRELGDDVPPSLLTRLERLREQLAAAEKPDDLTWVHRLIEQLEFAIMTTSAPPAWPAPRGEPGAPRGGPDGAPDAPEEPSPAAAAWLGLAAPQRAVFAQPVTLEYLRALAPAWRMPLGQVPVPGPDLSLGWAPNPWLTAALAVPGFGVVAAVGSALRAVRPQTWWNLASLLSVFVSSVIPMAVATGSVLSAVYFPNATFGSAGDYLSLFFAAAGTASATGIISALLLAGRPSRAVAGPAGTGS